MNKRNMKDLEECMSAIELNILKASTDLSDMQPGKDYESTAKTMDSLASALQKLYSTKKAATEKPEEKEAWWKRQDWTKLICCLMACGFTMWQSIWIISMQNEGVLFSREGTLLKMPRPF